jgi:hypothetical protein
MSFEMHKTAKPGHIFVWTKLAESLRGIVYPAEIDLQEGEPVFEHFRTCCPLMWVEKGYVREVPVDVSAAYGNDCVGGNCEL